MIRKNYAGAIQYTVSPTCIVANSQHAASTVYMYYPACLYTVEIVLWQMPEKGGGCGGGGRLRIGGRTCPVGENSSKRCNELKQPRQSSINI